MNVFILCTGRCGSTTFSRACEHMTNYTVGHETNINRLGAGRVNYPDNHIEVDNRLSWFLGRLEQTYGDTAFYVHLLRERGATVASFEKRAAFGIMAAYREGVYLGLKDNQTAEEVADDYYITVNANIRAFLRDKNNKFTVELEELSKKFATFWRAIGAEGDINEAMMELESHHNASARNEDVI